MVSRMTGSVLNALDLNELITDNLSDYENLVVQLSQQPEAVTKLKQRLAHKLETKSTRTSKLTRSFEKALLQKIKQQR